MNVGGLRNSFGFNLCDPEGVANIAKVRRVSRLQDKRQCTANNVSSEVCWHGLAALALNSVQHIIMKCAKGSSILAKRGRLGYPSRPRCRHNSSVAVGATSEVLTSRLTS
jgi:hypothetical protein